MSELSRARKLYYKTASEHVIDAIQCIEFALEEYPPECDRKKLLRVKAFLNYSLPFLHDLPKI